MAGKLQRLLAEIAAQGLNEGTVLKAATTTPVVRTPRKKGKSGNMFVLEGDDPPEPEKPYHQT